jgi:hypothetical protein
MELNKYAHKNWRNNEHTLKKQQKTEKKEIEAKKNETNF